MQAFNNTGRKTGFTLIELVIAVVIVGILSAIAFPMYMTQIRKANRSDATTTLLFMAAEQEKFFLKNNRYASNATELGIVKTTEEMYSLSMAANAPVVGGFLGVATAQASAQVKDLDCQIFTIDHTGQRVAWGSNGTNNTDICW